MNLYRYYEAKAQNRNTISLLRNLDDDGRLKTLPSAIGKHYRKFDTASSEYDPLYCSHYERDRYLMNILTCANDIQAIVSKNGDLKVTGAQHCGYKALCACCGTREARRVSSQLAYMFFVNRDNNLDYFMLTLTLPNRHDGFREEFKIYDKCLNPILHFIGHNQSKEKYNYIKGFFASRELTYTKEKGFHPHIHIIVAYDKSKVGNIQTDRKGCIKHFDLLSARGKTFSTFDIRNCFQENIKKFFPDYYFNNIDPLVNGLNIDFRHIDDIDNACDEICKYFIDYNSFSDPDSLYIYMRDIYQIRKYTKRGVFGWSEEREELWRKWCMMGKPTVSNFHFIYFAGHFDTKDYVYFGHRKVVDNGKLIDFPCYYKRSDLACYGDPFMLHYNKHTETYSNTIYDNSVGRLITICFNKDRARIVQKEAFNLRLQRQYDYYKSTVEGDPERFNRRFDIDTFKEGRINDETAR